MAVRFRNLQGGNPYQGLANTMERVAGRVGASYMSYGQAVRQRNERRDALKAQQEKSLTDAITKLIPAAVGYEQQKDRFEYQKQMDEKRFGMQEERLGLERDRLESQSQFQQDSLAERKRSSQVTEGLAKQRLEEQVRQRKVAEQSARSAESFRQYMKQQSDILAKENRDWRKVQEGWRNEDRKMSEELQRLRVVNEGKKLDLARDKVNMTVAEEAKVAATIAGIENKYKDGLLSGLRRQWAIHYGAEIGTFGSDDYIAANPNAPGYVEKLKGKDGKEVGGPGSTFDQFLINMGYKNGTGDEAFQPSTTKDILRIYGSEEALKRIEESGGKPPEPIVNPEDEFKSEIAETNLKLGNEGGNQIAEKKGDGNDLSRDGELSVLENSANLKINTASLLESGSIGAMNKKYEGMGIDQLKSSLTASGISSSEKEFIRDKIDSIGGSQRVGQLAAAERPEQTAKDMVVNTRKGRNLNIRSGPSSDSEKIGTIAKGTSVRVIETKGKWSRIETDDGQVAWVATRFLK